MITQILVGYLLGGYIFTSWILYFSLFEENVEIKRLDIIINIFFLLPILLKKEIKKRKSRKSGGSSLPVGL